ncbi:hypothetical protein BC829DRAFT_447571 [Chytridium lagenaria]|nr:hypothetical protein BC829DRAFT_447571 [Chytridium lagenaria]
MNEEGKTRREEHFEGMFWGSKKEFVVKEGRMAGLHQILFKTSNENWTKVYQSNLQVPGLSNTLVYFFFLGSDVATSYGGINLEKFETYLTPAPWALWAWVAINFLFGGFVIWQWFPNTEEIVEHGVGPWFAIAGVWLPSKDSDKLVLATIVTLLASGATSLAYYNLNRSYPAQTFAQNILVHAPHVHVPRRPLEDPRNPSVFDIILVLLVQIKLAATASGYTEWRHESGDVAGSSVIAWFLFAVSAGQSSPWVSWPAFILAIYVAVHAIFRPAHHHFVAARNSEQDPPSPRYWTPGNPPIIPPQNTPEGQGLNGN